jgi:triacylglycerol lipase
MTGGGGGFPEAPWTERKLTPVTGGWPGRPLAETRWMLEAARLLADPVAYGHGVPRGDGRAVLLLPGFLAGDESLLVLRGWLRRMGYAPYVCGFRFNVDCADRAVDLVEFHAERAAAETGRRVAVIGHSRGGHFARAMAARRPDLVSHAISMGADLQGMFGISAPTRAAVGLARRAAGLTRRARSPTCFRARCTCDFVRDFNRPFPEDAVRLTSIYSRGDGVVRWQRMLVEEADNVEVSGSHVGLMANRKAYRVIAAALAQPELAGADAQ